MLVENISVVDPEPHIFLYNPRVKELSVPFDLVWILKEQSMNFFFFFWSNWIQFIEPERNYCYKINPAIQTLVFSNDLKTNLIILSYGEDQYKNTNKYKKVKSIYNSETRKAN